MQSHWSLPHFGNRPKKFDFDWRHTWATNVTNIHQTFLDSTKSIHKILYERGVGPLVEKGHTTTKKGHFDLTHLLQLG